jgi:hypothetical protein
MLDMLTNTQLYTHFNLATLYGFHDFLRQRAAELVNTV